MLQIAYTSIASDNFGSGEVFKIIEKSARNNQSAGLTGFLIYSNDRFFQVVEGPVESIDQLMRRLELDPRHHSINIVHRCAIAKPCFPNWRMKRVNAPEPGTPLEELAPELSNAPFAVKRLADDFLGLALS